MAVQKVYLKAAKMAAKLVAWLELKRAVQLVAW